MTFILPVRSRRFDREPVNHISFR